MFGRPWWTDDTPSEKIAEWRDNKSKAVSGEKNPNYGKHWNNEMRCKIRDSESTTKQVLRFNLNGDIIEEHASIRQAAIDTGFNRAGISRCCRYLNDTCGGYYWMFKSEYEKHKKLIHKSMKDINQN